MQSDHFIEVMAVLNAIVRCFNDTIKKIDIGTLAQPSLAPDAIAAVTMSTMEAKSLIKWFMKVAGYISVLAIASLLLANVTNSVAAGGKGENPHKQRGAVSTKNSSKQSTNQNAQWSADPDRGWVRSDQSHSIQRRDRLSTAPKQTDGKNKGSGKARKRF
jgi:hypothetical protein